MLSGTPAPWRAATSRRNAQSAGASVSVTARPSTVIGFGVNALSARSNCRSELIARPIATTATIRPAKASFISLVSTLLRNQMPPTSNSTAPVMAVAVASATQPSNTGRTRTTLWKPLTSAARDAIPRRALAVAATRPVAVASSARAAMATVSHASQDRASSSNASVCRSDCTPCRRVRASAAG